MKETEEKIKKLKKQLADVIKRYEVLQKEYEAADKVMARVKPELNRCAYLLTSISTELGKYDPKVVMKKLINGENEED